MARCNYSQAAISEALGEAKWFTPMAIDLPRFGRRVKEPTVNNTLIRLLLLGETVPAELVQQALQPMTLDAWIEAGLLHRPTSQEGVCSAVRLTPLDDFLLAADCPQVDAMETAADFVMPPAGTSLQLGWSAIRHAARRTLDLGTGCGYLGLVASAFSSEVVATDRNERAVAMARFNARLNQIDRMETRVGDLWDPVVGERFDLVLSNPPFVITPQRRLLFRDSGMRGDEFCRRLIREVPAYLEQGGFCQMLGNYAHRRDKPWRQDLSDWFSDLGCDVLVLVTRRQPIDEYAMDWITSTESQDVAVVPRMFNEWMDYYESEQIEQVSYLSVNLRQRSGSANWIYVDEEEVRIAGQCGDAIHNRFALLDFLVQLPSDAALMDECLMLDPHAQTCAGARDEHRRAPGCPKSPRNVRRSEVFRALGCKCYAVAGIL